MLCAVLPPRTLSLCCGSSLFFAYHFISSPSIHYKLYIDYIIFSISLKYRIIRQITPNTIKIHHIKRGMSIRHSSFYLIFFYLYSSTICRAFCNAFSFTLILYIEIFAHSSSITAYFSSKTLSFISSLSSSNVGFTITWNP